MSAISTVTPSTPPRALHWSLWAVQVLVALLFVAAGTPKIIDPPAEMAGMLRFAGISEVLGAVGLILPSALRILPVLTPIAAGALGVVMVLAFGMHASNAEWGTLPVVSTIFGLLMFVAWGRSTRAKIASR